MPQELQRIILFVLGLNLILLPLAMFIRSRYLDLFMFGSTIMTTSIGSFLVAEALFLEMEEETEE